MYTYTRPPSGAFPCEAFGTIDKTGQEFSFRCRGGQASIRIDAQHPINERTFNKKVSVPAAALPTVADDLISHWISMQLREHDIARVISALWQNCVSFESDLSDVRTTICSFKANESGNIVSGAFKTGNGVAVFQLSADSLNQLLFGNTDSASLDADEISGSEQDDTTFFKIAGKDWTVNFTFISTDQFEIG